MCWAFQTKDSGSYGKVLQPTQAVDGGGKDDAGVVREPGPAAGAPEVRDAAVGMF